MAEKKTFTEKIGIFTDKISGPLLKISSKPAVEAIQEGLIQVMPVIIIGSIFLILYVLGSPSIGDSGKPLLPFLEPLADKFVVVNSLTLGFLGLYSSITIAMCYAGALESDVKNAAVLGIVSFIIINIDGLKDGVLLDTTAFSATGLIIAIITSIISVRVYKFCIDKNIGIKLPDSVPPNIGKAFSALIPFLIVFTIAWLIRTVIGFNLVGWLTSALTPLFSAADNIGVYTLKVGIGNLFWSVGLHGENMFAVPIFQPFELIWTAENAAALANGVPGTELPHIMTYSGIDRLTNWTACIWPLVFLMITSKIKYLKTLGWACLPPAIFTIIEPVIFGLPLALNPFLIIPFLLTGVVTAIVSYSAFSLGLIGRFYATMPWATPPFLLGPIGTGDWKTIILVVVVFFIGLLIYYPFFKQFEKAELKKEEENEAKLAAETTQSSK